MATVLVLVFLSSVAFFGADRPILIAHRGVSAYLTEHTLESVTLAYGQGAVFVEQDLYGTRWTPEQPVHRLLDQRIES